MTNNNHNNNIPLFWESEIVCGTKLGSGTYCEVLDIKDIVLLRQKKDHKKKIDDTNNDSNDEATTTKTNDVDDDDDDDLPLPRIPQLELNDDIFRNHHNEEIIGIMGGTGGGAVATAAAAAAAAGGGGGGGSQTTTTKQQQQQQQQQHQRQTLAYRFEITRHIKPDPYAAIYGKQPQQQSGGGEARDKKPKLACKRLLTRKKTKEESLYDALSGDNVADEASIAAERDFYRELNILMKLSSSHDKNPNIIDLCGIGFEDTNSDLSQSKPSCLLLSRIRSTLTQRLGKWRNEQGLGIRDMLSWDVAGRKHLWLTRLIVLSKIAHAVQHLHEYKILYRDLKPDNIGFDYEIDDMPKLFDFGLAKYILISNNDNNDEGLFQLTPDTGTLRYMAAEVGCGQKYGWTADVYSFSILMHEILSLKTPFVELKYRTQFRDLVHANSGGVQQILQLPENWPVPICNLLTNMWDTNPKARPSMEQVTRELDDILRAKNDEDLFPSNLVLSTTTTTTTTSSQPKSFTSIFFG